MSVLIKTSSLGPAVTINLQNPRDVNLPCLQFSIMTEDIWSENEKCFFFFCSRIFLFSPPKKKELMNSKLTSNLRELPVARIFSYSKKTLSFSISTWIVRDKWLCYLKHVIATSFFVRRKKIFVTFVWFVEVFV